MRTRYVSEAAATMLSLAGLALMVSSCSDTVAPASRVAPAAKAAYSVVGSLPGIPAGSTVINLASGSATQYCGYTNPYPATAGSLQAASVAGLFTGVCGAPVDLTGPLVTYNPGWSAPLAGSAWIGPVLIDTKNSIGAGTSNEYKPLPGVYKFTTTFTVPTGVMNPLLRLSLRSDNAVIVYLNDVNVGQNTIEDCNRSTAVPCNWDTQINVTDASAFHTGLNTLRIDLVDTPAGLGFNVPGTYCFANPPSPSADGHFVTPYDLSKCANPAGVSFIGTVSFIPAPPPTTGSCVSITAIKGVAITPVQVSGSGGNGGPYKFSATGLPAGLTMATDGTISGTPTVTGTFAYTVTVTDKDGNKGTFNCSLVVYPPPSCSCTTITTYKGTPMTPTSLPATGGAGGPYTFVATGLPNGVTLSSSGVLSGTPMSTGTFYYVVTITDKNGNKSTITCTLIVTYDMTPPVCSVYENASPAYMTYQDNGSGIVRLDVTTNLNSNFDVTVTPTPAGTTFSPSIASQPAALPTGTVIKFASPVTSLIKVSAVRIDSHKSAQLTVKATNAVGATVTCDPVETTITRLKQDDGDQTFKNLPYEEHFVKIDNGGLKSVDVIVNGTTFKVKRLDDDEVRTIDVSSAMKHNNSNTITVSPNGKRGDSADITIGPNP